MRQLRHRQCNTFAILCNMFCRVKYTTHVIYREFCTCVYVALAVNISIFNFECDSFRQDIINT